MDKPRIEDVVESLTGFEEIAVEKQFGAAVTALNETMSARALVFVLNKRANGGDDVTAKREAMQASLKEILATFADEGAGDEGNDG
jgi:hypothetical protein